MPPPGVMAVRLTREDTDEVLHWLHIQGEKAYSSTRFDNLHLAALTAYQERKKAAGDTEAQPPSAELAKLTNSANYLYRDWQNLLTVLCKLEWMQELTQEGKLDDYTWTVFAASDVDMFHVEMRSAFDYLASIISCLSSKFGQAPGDSYNSLVKWCKKDEVRASRLLRGDMRKQVVESGEWFHALKKIREENVHRGAFNMVFPDEKEILFQVDSARGKRLILDEHVMHNENLADFARYAAASMIRLWRLAEYVSARSFERFQLEPAGLDGVRAHHSGLAVLREWTVKLRAVLPSRQGVSDTPEGPSAASTAT